MAHSIGAWLFVVSQAKLMHVWKNLQENVIKKVMFPLDYWFKYVK